MSKINATLKGITGIGSIELLQMYPTDPSEIQEMIKLIIQVAVGLVTIWTMIKKKKGKSEEQTKQPTDTPIK